MMITGNLLNFVAQVAEEFQAVHSGQFNIRQNYIGGEFWEFRESVFAAANAQDVAVPLAKQRFVAFAGIFLIFDDENALWS